MFGLIFNNMFIKTIFDPTKGIYNQAVGTEAEAIVDLGTNNLSSSFINGETADSSVASISDLINVVGRKIVWVDTIRDFFIRLPNSSRTVDNIEVVATDTGVGRWERQNSPHPSWANQTTIHVHATLGNDEYDGTSATFVSGYVGPLRSMSEVIRRLGAYYAPKINQTIQLGVGTYDTRFAWTVSGVTGNVHIKGTLIPRATITLSAVTNQAPATNVEGTITATGWTVANEIRKLAIGGVTNQAAIVMEAGAGVGEAIMSTWGIVDPVTPPLGSATTGNIANGSTVTTYDWGTLIDGINIVAMGGARAVIFSDLQFECSIWDFRILAFNAQVCYTRCRINQPASSGNISGGSHYFNICLWDGADSAAWFGNLSPTRAFLQACLVRHTFFATTAVAAVSLRNDTIFDGKGYGTAGQMSRMFLDGVCFRKVTTGNLVNLAGNSTARVNGRLWGTNTTTGTKIALERGCRVTVLSTQVANLTCVTSGTSDFSFAVNTVTGSRVFDVSTGTYGAARLLNFANLTGSIAAGGFNNAVFDPSVDCSVIIN